MRLRRPCEHELYEEHVTYPCPHPQMHHPSIQAMHDCRKENFAICPGGEFLPEGALWYCTTHRAAESAEEGTCEVAGVLSNLGRGPYSDCEFVKALFLDALASQVGESE